MAARKRATRFVQKIIRSANVEKPEKSKPYERMFSARAPVFAFKLDLNGFLLDSQAVYRVQVIDKREQQQNQSICIDSASAIESRIEGYNFTSLSVSRTRLIP